MRQMYLSPCIQEIRMRRSKKEEQETDIRSDKNKIQPSETKIRCFLKCVSN